MCGHLSAQLAASERKCGRLAQDLDALRDMPPRSHATLLWKALRLWRSNFQWDTLVHREYFVCWSEPVQDTCAVDAELVRWVHWMWHEGHSVSSILASTGFTFCPQVSRQIFVCIIADFICSLLPAFGVGIMRPCWTSLQIMRMGFGHVIFARYHTMANLLILMWFMVRLEWCFQLRCSYEPNVNRNLMHANLQHGSRQVMTRVQITRAGKSYKPQHVLAGAIKYFVVEMLLDLPVQGPTHISIFSPCTQVQVWAKVQVQAEIRIRIHGLV